MTGTRLRDGIAITIGGNAVPSADIEVVNTELVRFKTPAHAAGAVAVQVTNLDATTVTKSGAFTYA